MNNVMNFKIVGELYSKSPITHIAFDMVDEKEHIFYGQAFNYDWGGNGYICRVVVTGADEVFNKALSLYKRGVNMFNVGVGIVIIE